MELAAQRLRQEREAGGCPQPYARRHEAPGRLSRPRDLEHADVRHGEGGAGGQEQRHAGRTGDPGGHAKGGSEA
eukprot:758931-Hanusia_phi.AAC.3